MFDEAGNISMKQISAISLSTMLRKSRKKILASVFITAACLMAIQIKPAHAYDKAKLFDAFLSIVMIKGYTLDGSMAYGSGVVVAKNKVLTNCHIMRETKEPWVAKGEDTFAITAVQADRYHDLCLVNVDNLPYKAAQIGSINQLNKGAPIVSIGHSSANPSPVTAIGKVRAVYPFHEGLIISGTARFSMGASGSGMFDDVGNLIGINTFKSPGRNAYFYALPIEWLKQVEKLPVETQFPITGKAFWEEAEQDKPYFMRVVQPEINENWTGLQEIALKWTKAEPNNAEAWYVLGYALEMTKQSIAALDAYHKALTLNPQHTEAMFRLGLSAAEKGNNSEFESLQKQLATLDSDLADQLAQRVNCKSEC